MTNLKGANGDDLGFTKKGLAKALIDIALGNSFDFKALEAAENLAMTTMQDKFMLWRWSEGVQESTDHVSLQCLALRINADLGEETDVL